MGAIKRIKRIKRSEAVWREIIARHAASGMSVLEFCRGQGINPGVFRRWRYQLSGARPRAAQIKTQKKAERAAPFIDIGGMDAGRSRFQIRLELGAGMILSIERG